MEQYSETRARTLAKVISWRVALTTSHIVNALIVTGSLITGLQIAGLAAVINSVLFWLHERAWNWAQWNKVPNETKVFTEKQSRTFGKIATWRVLITASNFVIPWIVTGSWQSGVAFLTLATVVNMFVFWLHERIWNAVSWGKQHVVAA